MMQAKANRVQNSKRPKFDKHKEIESKSLIQELNIPTLAKTGACTGRQLLREDI